MSIHSPSRASTEQHAPNNFDFLRLAAAGCVLVSHQHALMGLPEPNLSGIQTIGGFGVIVFFVISGFLVAQSWQSDPHLGRFAARRLLRIWPGFAVVILMAALLLGPALTSLSLRDYFADPTFALYLKNLYFNLHDSLPVSFEGSVWPNAVNGSLWTIPLELRCYLLLAIAALAGLLRFRWLLLATVLALALAHLGPPPLLPHGVPESFHWSQQRRPGLEFTLYFFAGTLLNLFGVHRSARAALVAVGFGCALALLALAAQQPLFALWLAAPAAILAVANASTPVLCDAGRFGDLSYGLYIYAFPVQQTLIRAMRDRLPWNSLLLLTAATTLALAYASWHLVEKRALRLKPRKPRAREAPRSGEVSQLAQRHGEHGQVGGGTLGEFGQ